MTIRSHALFWSLSFLGVIGFIYLFKGILMPFVLGFAVAYLLNPLVNAFGKMGINRGLSALLILGTFLIVLFTSIGLLTPLVYKQSQQFVDDVPGYTESFTQYVEPLVQRASILIGEDNAEHIKSSMKDQSGSAGEIAKKILAGIAAGGQAIFDTISILVLMPIVAYFLMKEWLHITEWAKGLMPRDHKDTILGLLSKIDKKISGFVRGQISVAAILGISYAIALSIAGLKYGFLIGLVAGLISIIPMVGSTVGLVVSVAVAWFQAGEWSYVAIIAAIFLFGQLIEGNVLSPKIIGDNVGMHPLWVFFALMAGGSLFGVLGMLIAVPMAAVAGVLLTFAIAQYKLSPYFKGTKKPASKETKSKKATNKS